MESGHAARAVMQREMERTLKWMPTATIYIYMNECMFEPNIIRSNMAGGKLKKKKKKC